MHFCHGPEKVESKDSGRRRSHIECSDGHNSESWDSAYCGVLMPLKEKIDVSEAGGLGGRNMATSELVEIQLKNCTGFRYEEELQIAVKVIPLLQGFYIKSKLKTKARDKHGLI